MIDIGRMIESLRKERGWTQGELAARVDCTRQLISNYERGHRRPSYEMLEALSDAFNVPIGFLVTPDEKESALRKEFGDDYIDHDSESLLIGLFRALNSNGRAALLATARGLVASPEMCASASEKAG